jgi:hypothetical protein
MPDELQRESQESISADWSTETEGKKGELLMPVKMIMLRCYNCGEEKKIAYCCPVTGWEYNSGWALRCPNCDSTMEQRDDPISAHTHAEPESHVTEGETTLPAGVTVTDEPAPMRYECECEKVQKAHKETHSRKLREACAFSRVCVHFERRY